MAVKDFERLMWRETSRGHYERGIDEPELFYTTLAKRWEATGRIYFAMTGYIEVLIELSEHEDTAEIDSRVETALLKGWRRLRYDHPTLAAVIEYDDLSKMCIKTYDTFIDDKDGAKEKEWLTKSFVSVDNGQSGVEFCNSDPPIHRYATLYLITPPIRPRELQQQTWRKSVVFRCHHDLIDGIGTLMLLNNLIHHASEAYKLHDDYPEVQFSDEHRNLSPPFRIAASIPPDPTSTQKDRARLIKGENAMAAQDVEVIGIPFQLGAETPGISQRTAIYLSKEETSMMIQKCKATGFSATQAFHAGIVIAVRDIQTCREQERKARYINYCLINLRSFCITPYNTSQHAASVYHSGSGRSLIIDVTIPAKSSPRPTSIAQRADFTAIASQIKTFYRAVQSDPEHLAMVPLYYEAIIPPYPTSPSLDIPPPNARPSVSISSLGIVDHIIKMQHGSLHLDNPWVAADEYSTGVGVFLATWKGRMCLSAGFNLAFHMEEQVVEFLERVKSAVVVGLGVE